MKSLLARVLATAAALAIGAGAAIASESVKLDRALINPADVASLQSGARTFVNYCLNCHGAALVRYNQLTGIGLTEAQITDNLLFTGAKVGDMMKIAANAADQKEWFGVVPPDLSVIARSRGPDWLYSYLRGFYRDPSRPIGWNNTVFPNVGMPHVLWPLQGIRDAKVETVSSHGHETKEIVLGAPAGGSQSAVDYDKTVLDLVNFLTWMGEPHAAERKRTGYYVLIALAVLIFLSYALKAAYWKDVH